MEPETSYAYRIKARNAGGLSERSAQIQRRYPSRPRPGLEQPGHGRADHQWHASGGGDADGGHVGHRRRRRAGTRHLQLPVVDRRGGVHQSCLFLGATEAAYTLRTSDEGKVIRVRVSFIDDAGYEESRTSAATAAVEAEPGPQEPPARPTGLTGTVAHDAVSLTWDDPGDATITGYRILRRNPAVDAPGDFHIHVHDTESAVASYVDRDVEPETRYVYRIKAINAAGVGPQSDYFRADIPSAPNRQATGAPTITGILQVGETLTVDTSAIADADGMDNVTFSYQWVVTDGGAELDIPGATGASYTLKDNDAGLRFMVRVSFRDDAGNEETRTSADTGAVQANSTGLVESVTYAVFLARGDPGDAPSPANGSQRGKTLSEGEENA